MTTPGFNRDKARDILNDLGVHPRRWNYALDRLTECATTDGYYIDRELVAKEIESIILDDRVEGGRIIDVVQQYSDRIMSAIKSDQ